MKKIMNASVLVKEAALWEKMKETVQKRPATVCHK
jgi:hypothetical protein